MVDAARLERLTQVRDLLAEQAGRAAADGDATGRTKLLAIQGTATFPFAVAWRSRLELRAWEIGLAAGLLVISIASMWWLTRFRQVRRGHALTRYRGHNADRLADEARSVPDGRAAGSPIPTKAVSQIERAVARGA